MSEIAELIERLRPTPEKHEERMQQWDYARKLVADGHAGSHPRDIVESVIDALEMDGSEAADARATLTARAETAESRLAKAVEALRSAQTWHEENDKALSKQPPSYGPNGTAWARLQHQEQMNGIRATLSELEG